MYLRHASMRAEKEGELSWEMDAQLREASASPTLAELADALEGRHRRRRAAPDVRGLPPGALQRGRAALTLKLVGGLSSTEKSRAPSWCRKPRWRSASCAPSAPWRKRRCRSRRRARTNASRAWRRCCR
jgi:hypothetical protein